MATNEPNQDDDDPDTIAAFTRLLNKIGPERFKEWLKEHNSSSSPSPTPATDLTTYLQSALSKAEKANESLMAQLEELRDQLTPEQLIQWRSRKNVTGSDEPDGKKDPSGRKPNGPPSAPVPDPTKGQPKKRAWL